MILLIDNYDSFSYNLVQMAGTINPEIKVVRNDKITIPEIRALNPSHIILSPGPGYPKDAGICEEVVKNLGGEIPMLGVCLGHQAICEAYGGTVRLAKKLMHGKQSIISVDTDCILFKGMPPEIGAARYHSLVGEREGLPETLKIVADEAGGEVMAVADAGKDVYGLQFHPESILTPDGIKIMRNFLSIRRASL